MITAQIATIADRNTSLRKAIGSIVNQVDILGVIYNGESDLKPGIWTWATSPGNLWYIYPHGADRMSDGWKFYNIDGLDAYIFILDDDIEYPADFVKVMIDKVEQYKRKAVITCMGKILKPRPISSFYKDELICYKTFETLTKDQEVEIPGTCAMAFHSSTCPDLNHTYFQSMNSDIWMGKYCKEKGIKMIVTAHEGTWLKNIFSENPKGTFSVFDTYKNDDKEMTDLVNSFL